MNTFEDMADREQAHNWGAMDTDRAWVLTDRDVWHRNWAYTGPEMPHPEDDGAYERIDEIGIEAWRAERAAFRAQPAPAQPDYGFAEIPF